MPVETPDRRSPSRPSEPPKANGAYVEDGRAGPTPATLLRHWYVALDTAEAALTMSLRAEILKEPFCAVEFKLLREERHWLEHAPFD